MVNRNAKGQVEKGSVLNPKGRQPREKEHDYLNIMLSIVTDKRWKAIVKKAADQAERGDAVARKWLADYLIGPPKQDIDVTSAGEKLCVVIRGPTDESDPGDV